MKRLLIAAILALTSLGAAHAALPAGVTESTFTAPDATRTLQFSVEIAAPPAIVWKAFSDPDFIKASGVTGAWVDLRNGGVMEQGLVPNAQPGNPMNIRHEIITLLPQRLMVLRNQNVPAGVPGAAAYPRIVQVVQLDDLGGGRTRLTLSGVGYGAGEDFQKLFAFFQEHNGEFLAGLKAQAEKAAKGG